MRSAHSACARLRGDGRRGVLRRAADQFIDLNARVSDRLEPRLRILPHTSVQQAREEPRRRRAGSAANRARARSRSRSRPRSSSPSKAGAAGQHLVEHDTERPDVGALISRLARRLLGTHVGRRAEDHSFPSSRRLVIVGDCVRSVVPRRRSVHASRDQSPALSRCRPDVILIFAGFKSRWMIPCSCAASSASAICCAIVSASSSGMAPCAIRSASVSPSTNSMTSAGTPSASSSRRSRRCGDD